MLLAVMLGFNCFHPLSLVRHALSIIPLLLDIDGSKDSKWKLCYFSDDEQ
jgi:hypothetical protein